MKKGELYFVILVFLIASSHVQAEVAFDDEKPTAQIIVPTAGQVISGEFVVRAKAIDNVEVERVEFLLDGVAVFTDTIPTAEGIYQWLWDSSQATNGAHDIIVAPYDASGNFNDLTRVSVTVNNGAATQPVQQPSNQMYQPPPPSQPAPIFSEPTAEPATNPMPVIPEAIPQPVQSQPVQIQPPVQQPAQQTQSAPARGAVPTIETSEEVETDAEKPLWLTLLMSFGLIVIAGGLLAFAFVKMRASPDVPDSIKTYVSMSMQRGYPVSSVQRALQSQGWDDKVIEEAFKQAIQR